MTRRLISLALALALAAALVPPAVALPVGTSFVYQGKVTGNSLPSNATCNFQFGLYDALTAGTHIGSTLTLNGIAVKDGIFSVELDFGVSAFDGSARWLEIWFQGPSDPSLILLSPRQRVAPTPYAIYALNNATGLALPYGGAGSSTTQTMFTITNNGTTGLVHGINGRTYSTTQNATGVLGEGLATSGFTSGVQGYASGSSLGTGVVGVGAANGGYFRGDGVGSDGVEATSATGNGVNGYSTSGNGVYGYSSGSWGVYAKTDGATKAGVFGQTTASQASGILGRNESTNNSGQGVYGYASSNAVGVLGISEGNDGLSGRTNATSHSGVFGYTAIATSYGGLFRNDAINGVALKADGLAQVRSLQILGGADLAEPFDVSDAPDGATVEPGTVVCIDPSHPGDVRASDQPYDTRVAGVISGANGLAPGMVMRAEGGALADGHHPVALTGRVWCRVDASYGPVRPGDLLTTSPTRGMAMRADPAKAGGATLGKAMTGLASGRGLVLVLVSLE